MDVMNTPGFSADASLYHSQNQYMTTCIVSPDSVSPQQLRVALDDTQLYWCQVACAYCRWTGYYCWYCYYCAWIIVLWPRTIEQ